jgi:two-component system sensor histidine kinase KdpD
MISMLLVLLSALVCFFVSGLIGYRGVALALLLMVSVSAMLFDIFPVLLTAVLSALIWNFFFIPPVMTWHIERAEDALMFLMYFVIALINAALTYNIRDVERKEGIRAEKEQSLRLYNTVLNSLSHELRTPIATIIGAIDTIKGQQNQLSKAHQETLYNEIEIASLRLNRQVENLLSMSRLEAGVLQAKPDWCDVNETIYGVLEDLSDQSAQHQVLFDPKEQFPLCKLDRGLLVQVLRNILLNALQHTPAGTQVQIAAIAQAGACTIVISDNGPGFEQAEISQVFDKFYRAKSSAPGGTGLGLSIVKGFVEAMKGQVYLENNRGGGAVFTVVIPSEISSISDIDHE